MVSSDLQFQSQEGFNVLYKEKNKINAYHDQQVKIIIAKFSYLII